MPPKQKQVKKGPAYKTATPLKDIVPPTIKEPPREPRLLKMPDLRPQTTDKNAPPINPQFIFEQWPSEEIVKAHDFGINSQNKFQDKSHNLISEFLKEQLISNEQQNKFFGWKHLHEIQELQNQQSSSSSSENENQEIVPKSSVNFEGDAKKEEGQNEKKELKKPMVVIETYLREESEQQMEKRMKQEAERAQKAAKDKKKAKKEQPKEEGPLQVSDVKMSDIIVTKKMCPSGIWIGSQLQIIKTRELRDVYTNEPVWKKIYPQQNGVPQITKSGKYWVKLNFMGKAVKVEVDDRIPLSGKRKQLFPKSAKSNQKWTLILTKALIKLFALTNPLSEITGSGFIINSLTGMMTQKVKIQNFQDWDKLRNLLADDHYEKKDILVNCFSLGSNKKSPSNFIKNKQELKSIIVLQNSTFKKKGKRRSSAVEGPSRGFNLLQAPDLIEQKMEQEYIDTNLISGYAYNIGDYFENNDFNMIFSKDKNISEKKLRVQYNDMWKVVLGNKTRDEKLEHRRKKKEIKQKLQFEEKKRLDLINQPNKEYHFLKVLGNILISCQYSHKQILLAKKCVLNNLERPPNYEIPNQQKSKQKEEDKSQIKDVVKKYKQDDEVNPVLDDFSTHEDALDLMPRAQEGVWIKDQDLLAVFDEIQLLYNPNCFQNKSIEVITNKNPKQFAIEESKEILVVQKKGNPHLEPNENQQPPEQNVDDEQNKQEQVEQKIDLLFGFSYQRSKADQQSEPFCNLQKFDFESYRPVSNVVKLTQPLSGLCLTLNNQNSVFRIYTLSKGNYSYWFSSNATYKLMSMADYLTEFESYTAKKFNVEYSPIERGTILLISKLKIRHEGDQNNTILFKLKSCNKEIEQYLIFKIVECPQNGVYANQENQGKIIKRFQSKHLFYEYSKVQFEPNKTYYLVIQAYPLEGISEGSIELLTLSKLDSVSIEQTEQIQPYKVIQKYFPNKYGCICKERLFVNNNISGTLVFKVFAGEEGQPIVADKKAPKKGGGKEQPVFQVLQKELSDQRLIHLKIFKNGDLIYYGKDKNQIVISNIDFEATKQNVNYHLEASFDLREWPASAQVNDQTQKIYWSVQISGEDSIAIVKDTFQEEKQKQTRKSWQDKQPGRADKAKRARQRYLLELKLDRGQKLTQQEQQIVNAPRLTKKKQLEEDKKNEQKKGGKGAAKKQQKKGKDKKQEVVQQKKREIVFPKSQDNFMKEIKQFIENLENFKVHHETLNQGEEPRVRQEEEQNAIKEGAIMSKENRTTQIVRNIQTREVLKLKEKDKKDRLTIILEDLKTNFNLQWKQYLKWRTEDLEKDKVKQEKEKLLIEIINQDKPSVSQQDLTKLVKQYREIEGANILLADVAEMVRKNIRIGNLNDKISASLQAWDVQSLKASSQEIKNDRIEGLNEQMIAKLNSTLEEVIKNPAIVAQKQAELKKMKKGGKK